MGADAVLQVVDELVDGVGGDEPLLDKRGFERHGAQLEIGTRATRRRRVVVRVPVVVVVVAGHVPPSR
jgi:hypothetical protein